MSAPQNGYGALDGEQLACIPPGKYKLRFDFHETKRLFQRDKLFLWFTVIDYGDHFGTRLCRYYGLRRVIGKHGKHGKFAVGWKSDFLREYARLFGTPVRLDRIAMTSLEKVEIIGLVRTVSKGHDQREIPDGLRYSVIDELLKVGEGHASPFPFPTPIPLPPAPPTSES